jgi:CRISPR-associated protein Csm3
MAERSITLHGRVFITATIEAVTGLHIGGSDPGLEIGGLDNTIIRHPLSQEPYIPGSSLKGKMRSQTEKVLGLSQNQRIGQAVIHTCQRRPSSTTTAAARSAVSLACPAIWNSASRPAWWFET